MTGRFNKKPNPVEEEKAPGINIKQVVWIGALTALTGTIVGTVATEVYRHFRPKIPIPLPPPPGQVAQQVVQNPGYPQPQVPLGWAPAPQPNYAPPQPQVPAFVPAPVQQVGAFPVPQPQAQPLQYVPAYVNPPALPPGAYAPQAPALPSAPSVPAAPQPPPTQQQGEPLSRPELAQWQRRLETWERTLERHGRDPE